MQNWTKRIGFQLMNEHSWIAGAVTFGLVLGVWLALDWRRKHPRAERGDLFAAYDRDRRPVPAAASSHYDSPRFTDSAGNPRLPSVAETTAELARIADDYEKDFPVTVALPAVALEPTAVYPPPKAGPEPHEWTWWAGRWWPPAELEESLGASDWLRELLAAA
jgi:hypothetical protein